MRSSLFLIVLVACGSHAAQPDATGVAPDAADAMTSPDATPPDAMTSPDATLLPPPLTGTPVDFGDVGAFELSAPRTVTLTNTGNYPAGMAIHAGGLGVQLAAPTTCAETLDAHASCTVAVAVEADRVGAISGALEVDYRLDAVDVYHLDVPITAHEVGVIDVTRDGGGSGSIASSDGAIACGATCSALAAQDVTLTATADPGSRFGGWSWPGCGTALTCVVHAPGLFHAAVHAIFVPATGAVVLRIARSGAVPADAGVLIGGAFTRCSAPCAIEAKAGDTAQVYASTPSTYGGMTGACTTAAASCTATLTADADLTITASLDPMEQWSLAVPWTVYGAHADAQGRTAIGGDGFVLMVDGSGTPVWRAPLPADASAVGPDGAVYAQGGSSTLVKLDPDGNLLWQTWLARSGACTGSTLARQIAVSSAGDVAFAEMGAVEVFDAAGRREWMASGTPFETYGCEALFGALGSVWVEGERASDDHAVLIDFDANGTPYPESDTGIDLGTLHGQPWVFDLDASEEALEELPGSGADGTPAVVIGTGFDNFDPATPDDQPVAGAIVADADDLWWAHGLAATKPGYWLHHTQSLGVGDRGVIGAPVTVTGPPTAWTVAWSRMIDLERVAGGGAVVGGEYHGFGADGGFAQRFTRP